MGDFFTIKDHVFSGQHIREYPGALAHSQEDVVELHAKQYVPKSSTTNHDAVEVTVIGFHANAFPKEVYEIFWEALCRQTESRQDIRISSIWIADQAFQGQSAMLNRERMGNDPNWFDHSRDVLAMVNTFRKHMRRPIIGVGHSMGATQAVALAHYHPRLFTALVLIDPAMSLSYAPTLKHMMRYALMKPVPIRAKSFAAVEAAVAKDPFFKSWDRRAVKSYVDAAWRQVENAVEAKMPEHMEALHLVRPNPDDLKASELSSQQRYRYPDLDPDAQLNSPAYNPHTAQTYRFLPSLRPDTLYVIGKGSKVVPPAVLEERQNATGSGVGGSGGVQCGRVATAEVKGGHFCPMTNPDGTAHATVEWLAPQISKWREVEKAWAEEWHARSLREKQTLAAEVVDLYKTWDGKSRWTRASKM